MYKIFPRGNNSNIRYISERNGVPDKQKRKCFLDWIPLQLKAVQKKN